MEENVNKIEQSALNKLNKKIKSRRKKNYNWQSAKAQLEGKETYLC